MNFSKIFYLATALLLLFSCTQQKNLMNYNDFRFLEYSVEQMQEGFNKGDFSIKEVVTAYLERIEAIDKNGPALNSIITVNPDALTIAKELDKELKEGKSRGPLHGIPVLLKDNIDTHDRMPTTAGSRALADSYPLQDSEVARRLREAGAVILGKASLSEWANFRGSLSSSGWGGVIGQTKNPYDLSRNPCGSSSGSGAAISANLAMLTIGTETNGSIVCPSHANGIVGIKPTVGLVSRRGVIPIAESMDTPGPMGRSVADVAACLGVIAGIDTEDARTLASEGKGHTDYTQFLNSEGLRGKRIGFYTGHNGVNYKVDQVMTETIELLRQQGAEVIEINAVSGAGAASNAFTVMLYEYKEGLNNYFKSLGANAPIKNLEELIAFNKKDPVELKHYNQLYLELAQAKGSLDEPEYKKALEIMQSESRENGIDQVMDRYSLDAIMAPTSNPAWKTDLINGDNYQFGSSSPSAHAGYPIISLPMGYVDGLPVGVSFYGRAWSEAVLLEIAFGFESKNPQRKVPQFLNGE